MDVPELIPIEQYDARKAKLQASIWWLLHKAFGDDLPLDVQHPFTQNEKGQIGLEPVIVNGLLSADFYCRACENVIFKGLNLTFTGHQSVIEALSRKGIHAVDVNQSAVTENALLSNAPFKLGCHMSMIDALMRVHLNELVSVEKVVQAVRRFASFNASKELPFDAEDALLFWINKVCCSVKQRIEKQEPQIQIDIPHMEDLLKDINDGCCMATVVSFYCPNSLRVQDIELHSSVGIGDSLHNLQLLIEFCAAQHLPERVLHLTINDLFHSHHDLKPNLLVFLAEMFHQFEVVRPECVTGDDGRPGTSKKQQKLPTSSSASRPPIPISNATKRSFQQGVIQTEYAPDPQKTPSPSGGVGRQPLLPKRLQQRKNSLDNKRDDREPIRQSVQAWPDNPGPHGNPHTSLGEPTGRSSQSSSRSGGSTTLLGNVSMDSDASLDLTADTSMDLGSEEETPRPYGYQFSRNPNVTDPHHPDYMELESVPSRGSSAVSAGNPGHRGASPARTTKGNPHPHGGNPHPHGGNPHPQGNPHPRTGGNPYGNPHPSQHNQPLEPLMPAKLKPSKEKTSNHTKAVESGEKHVISPTSGVSKPTSLSLTKTSSARESDSDSTPDEEYQTPSVENVPFFDEKSVINQQQQQSSSSNGTSTANGGNNNNKSKQFEAFYVNVDDPNYGMAGGVPGTSKSRTSSRTSEPPARSFVLHDQAHGTRESALAAGIPVVDSPPRGGSGTARAGKGAAPDHRVLSQNHMNIREGSDDELRKIRADHHDKENVRNAADSFYLYQRAESAEQRLDSIDSRFDSLEPSRLDSIERPDSLNVMSGRTSGNKSVGEGDSPSPVTSFAQIKKQKDNGEIPQSMFYLHGNSSPQKTPHLDLKKEYQQRKERTSPQISPVKNVKSHVPGKKTQFTLPNQTTWQVTAQKKAEVGGDSNKIATSQSTPDAPLSSELVDIRLRLEERRKQMEQEKRRMEVQWNKQKQRFGKQAFMQVVSKSNRLDEKPEGEPDITEKPVDAKPPPTQPLKREVTPDRPVRKVSSEMIRSGGQGDDGKAPESVTTKEGEARPRAGSAEKGFSRQNIQNKIDSVRQKWGFSGGAGDGEGVTGTPAATGKTPRPKSYAGEGDDVSEPPRDARAASEPHPTSAIPNTMSSSAPGGTTIQEVPPSHRAPLPQQPVTTHQQQQQQPAPGTQPQPHPHMAPPAGVTAPVSIPTGAMAPSQGHPDVPPTTTTVSHSMSGSFEAQKDYSQSLDKLNSSLSELQGEIMKLSLSHNTTTTNSHPQSVHQHPQHPPAPPAPHHPRPEPSGGEPDVVSARSVPAEGTSQSLGHMSHPQPVIPAMAPHPYPQPGYPGFMPGQYPVGYVPYPTIPPAQPYVPPPIGYAAYPHGSGGYYPQMGYGAGPGQQQAPQAAHAVTSQPFGTSQPTQVHQHPSASATTATTFHASSESAFVPLSTQAQAVQSPSSTSHHQRPPSAGYEMTSSGHSMSSSRHSISSSGHPDIVSPKHDVMSASDHSAHSVPPSPGISSSITSPPPRISPLDSKITSPYTGITSPYVDPPLSANRVQAMHSADISADPGQFWISRSPTKPETKPFPAPLPDEGAGVTSSTDGEGDDEMSSSGTGFFISFDNKTPKRQKPKLKSREKKASGGTEEESSQMGKMSSSMEGAAPSRATSTPSPATAVPPAVDREASPGLLGEGDVLFNSPSARTPNRHSKWSTPVRGSQIAISAGEGDAASEAGSSGSSEAPPSVASCPPAVVDMPAVNVSPGVKLVIGDDEETLKSTEMMELEKRKQRFMEAQEKRRAQQEKKRLEQESKKNKKKEEQRLKQEAQEQKKAEEKAKREAIYQDYLKRKAEREEEEEMSKAGMSVNRRPKPKKAPRPKSQPPGVSAPGVQSSPSHSSQEDLVKQPGAGMSTSNPHVQDAANGNGDQVDSFHLAYGGLTHRRPPSPGKTSARTYVLGHGDAASDVGSNYSAFSGNSHMSHGSHVTHYSHHAQQHEYTGPKLFVKPSAKSNRHIIMNAISHCCLAGTVNTEVKNKVLEEVSKSEAKHYVILFRDGGCQFRAIYEYYPEREDLFKLTGNGPKQLHNKMMDRFYKYNSGGKSFSEITSTKHISVSIDTVTIQNQYWQKKNPAAKKPHTAVY